jgi:hypothetical protein
MLVPQGMVLYHLGFPVQSYLAAKVYPESKAIECHPLNDDVEFIMNRLDGHTEFLFHMDLTVQDRIPPRRAALIEALSAAGVKVHNGSHADQRKRFLQSVTAELGFPTLNAAREGDPNEKLFVKSDLNVAGGPERRTAPRFPGIPLPPLPSRVCSPFEYYAASRRDIPEDVWSDATLYIERYVENARGIVLRSFWNQGKAVVSVIENPRELVKKHNDKCRRWNHTEPVDGLTETAFTRMRRYAENLRLSFFTADWVVDENDGSFLVDLNLTPQWVVNPGTHTGNMTPGLVIYDIPNTLRV